MHAAPAPLKSGNPRVVSFPRLMLRPAGIDIILMERVSFLFPLLFAIIAGFCWWAAGGVWHVWSRLAAMAGGGPSGDTWSGWLFEQVAFWLRSTGILPFAGMGAFFTAMFLLVTLYRRTIRLDADGLRIDTRLIFWSWQRTIPLCDVVGLRWRSILKKPMVVFTTIRGDVRTWIVNGKQAVVVAHVLRSLQPQAEITL